jgi:hypothetical protein
MGCGRLLRRAHIEAFFVEFAVVIPILTAIAYYLYDIPK